MTSSSRSASFCPKQEKVARCAPSSWFAQHRTLRDQTLHCQMGTWLGSDRAKRVFSLADWDRCSLLVLYCLATYISWPSSLRAFVLALSRGPNLMIRCVQVQAGQTMRPNLHLSRMMHAWMVPDDSCMLGLLICTRIDQSLAQPSQLCRCTPVLSLSLLRLSMPFHPWPETIRPAETQA